MIEVLASLAILSAIGAIGYVTVTDSRKNAAETKLEADTATVNRAIEIYAVSGGNTNALTGTGTAGVETVLTELKKRASSSAALGVTGSTLDARVWYRASSESDPARAVWNNSTQRFEVVHGGGVGVKEFTLNEDLAAGDPATASRAATKETAGEGWVWAHADPPPVTLAQASEPGTGSAVNPSIAEIALPSFPHNGVMEVDETGRVVTDDKYYDGAGYEGEVGYASLEGMGNPPYDLTTANGLRDFMRELVRRVAEGGTQGGVALSKDGTGHTLNFPPGTLVALVLIPNDTFASHAAVTASTWTPTGNINITYKGSADFMAGSNPSMSDVRYPLTSLSFDTGDVAGFSKSQVVDLGHGVVAMEDLPGGGDRDYEDIVLKSTGLKHPSWSPITQVDPNTYYTHWDNPLTPATEDINRLDVTGDTLKNGADPTLRQALTNAGALP